MRRAARRSPALLLALAGLLALGQPAAAQSPAATALPVGRGAQPLTLAEAEGLLVERNLAVIAARAGVDAARANRLVASSLPPPSVTVGNTAAQFNETQRGGLQGGRGLFITNNVQVGLQVLVERGGKRTLRTRVAEEQIGVAEAQVLDTLRTQLFALRQAFLGALLARANLEVALGNRASLDRTEALLRRQFRDGAIPEGDLLRFQASRLPFESDVTGNAQAYAASIAALAALLTADPAAFDPEAGRIAAPPPPRDGAPPPVAERRGARTPAAAAPTTVQAILSPVAFDVRGRLELPPELGVTRDALAAGVASRPDVVIAARTAAAANQSRLLAEAARSRDVSVNANWARSRLSQNLPSDPTGRDTLTANNQFGVALSVPIFTGRIVEGNVAIAAAQQSQAEAQSRAALLGARADFAVAWAAYEQTRALVNLFNGGALQRAEEAYRSTEAAYAAGGRSLLDVLDSLRTLNATRLQANQARYAYLLALAQLEQASGVSGVAPRL